MALSHSEARPDDIRQLNKRGVEAMREGRLEAALAALQMALSLATGLPYGGGGGGDENNSGDAGQAAAATAAQRNDVVAVKSTTLNNLGCLYRRMHRLDEAIHHLALARDLETDALGQPSCSTLLNVCTVLLAMGNVDEALRVATMCVELSKSTNSRDDASIRVLSLHNLAVAQQSSGKIEIRRHATTTMLQALDASRRNLGEQHPTTVMLRVKCGVPPSLSSPPQEATAVSNGTKTITARPPQRKRNDVDSARQALRSLDFPTPPPPPLTVGGERRSPAQSTSSQLVTPPQPLTATLESSDAADVMAGAAFSDEMPPIPPHKVAASASAAVVVDATTATRSSLGTGAVVLTNASSSASAADGDVVNTATPKNDSIHQHRPPSGGLAATTTTMSSGVTSVTSSTTMASSSRAEAAATAAVALPHLAPAHRTEQVTHVLSFRRNATSNDRPPSFMRFAPNSVPPPPPATSFADIRAELRAERDQRRQTAAAHEWVERNQQAARSGAPRSDNRSSSIARSMGSDSQSRSQAAAGGNQAKGGPFSVAGAKKVRAAQEEAEERAHREHKKREEQSQRLEAAKRQRAEQLQEEHRHRAARKVQRAYRRWWLDTGFSKSLQRKQRDAEAKNKLAFVVRNQQRAAGGSSAASLLSRTVVRCAKIWLQKTAGRRLILRLGATRKEGLHRIETFICRLQRVWRLALARKQLRERRRARDAALNSITTTDHRTYSAKRIQRCVRKFLARRTLVQKRHDHYWKHVVVIQRWYRLLRSMRNRRGQRANLLHHRTQAALAIQKVWRGYLGRLAAVMRRLKRKVTVMKSREVGQRVVLQRLGRGYLARRAMFKVKESKASAARNVASLPTYQGTETTSTPSPSSAAMLAYAAAALPRAPAVQQLRELERENYHIPIAVETVAARHRSEYGDRQIPLQVRRERAQEEHLRMIELKTLQRERAARCIQRVYRRWKRLATATSRRTIEYATHVYGKRRFQQKEATRAETDERLRLRTTVCDLAREPRMLNEAVKQELNELLPTVRTHAAPEEVRDTAVRQQMSRETAEKEYRLALQERDDKASLRGVPTFLTQRQKRLLSSSSAAAPSPSDARLILPAVVTDDASSSPPLANTNVSH